MVSLNPLKWFGRPIEQKASAAAGAIAAYTLGRPVWTQRNYEEFAREAYIRNSVAFRCVKMIAQGASSPRLLLHSGDREIESHPLLDLINRPAPNVGGAAFFESVFTYFLLAGNAYIEAVGPRGKPPRELWSLRPDRMKVVPGSLGYPLSYEYTVNGIKKRWEMDPIRGTGPILHLKEFHPTDDWYGLSRVDPAAYGIDRHNAASEHNKALLDNGARPSGALIFEPSKGATGEDAKFAPEEVLKKAEERLMDRHGSAKNAGRPLVLGGNVKWEDMGINPKDMDFNLGKEDAARDICTAFGVPHILIVPGSATYNNLREAKLELWEEVTIPLIDRVLDQFNAWVAPLFGDEKLGLSADLDDIPALEPRRESKRKSTIELHKEGLIDDDEAREALQYGPRPEGEIKNVDAALLRVLIDGIAKVGYDPLLRYMISVGLADESTTVEQLIEAATDLLPDEEEVSLDAGPPNADQNRGAGNDATV